MCVGKQDIDFSDEILLVCKWDNMKLNLKEESYIDMDSIHLAYKSADSICWYDEHSNSTSGNCFSIY